MRYIGTAYRGHTPKWAFAPTSGEGAAIHGGRFNPKGVPALYLSTTPEGAFREATRGFAYKFDPLTLVTYDIDCTDIVDLTTPEARTAHGVDEATLSAPWFLDLSENRTPASWELYGRWQADKAGILVPSFAVGATPLMHNLVLWDWAEVEPHMVRVHDPEHHLPKNDDSWK